ncbi:hypothetical protein PQX77_008769 [Marasmius sp. AFHP31]|nr:hypothetical protein PQX77_008769 [Marasmius sp. AFHP31]
MFASTLKLEVLKDDDRRHLIEGDSSLQINHYFRHQGPTGDGSVTAEAIGKNHLIHCRYAQGHHQDPPTASAEFTRYANTPVAAENWYQRSWVVQQHLRKALERFFPSTFPEASRAFKAAVPLNHSDKGPWNGKVLIWKLPSFVHIDNEDAIPTLTYPMGCYEGGHLEILDLGARLLYRPGHIALGWTAFLFHMVSPWTLPKQIPFKDQTFMMKWGVTPGRVAVVNFFREREYRLLKDKPPAWGPNTNFGRSDFVAKEDDEGEERPKKKRRGAFGIGKKGQTA